MPDDTIYARLVAHTGLAALIAGRVYGSAMPSVVAERVFPLCVYSRVSDVPYTTMDWGIYGRDARYQVSCYAETRKAAFAVAEQVIAALHSYIAAPIKRTRYENLIELYEPESGPNGTPLYHVPVDFIVTYAS